ncbi:DNA methyltransferase [Hydrogenophilus thermoluteolus]|uniref:DNA methylase n=1 Tax=Hydrogenophilus thermoluteolus TaxID=297 RepID=A0A2Z6E033_HYDTE|nr:DNA methyltransferase [Hydrogenophilus thermoluteolus]BBD77930.1 DNA methylase [Hydrogenophilus thermoluteolus]
MNHQNNLFENQDLKTRNQEPGECLGQTFASDEARREHFLRLLREGLEELHAKLGGVPFTTVEDAVERMGSVEKWPMGDDAHLRELAERMRHADSNKDLLQRWKDEIGFPHGEIKDILNLSDPPYYTACPNPFIADFIKHYGKPYDPNVPYSKEPFAADVSEGKNDPIYNAHSYHTKVPHKAIMRYILHYTEPGDVVFDGFCGTGMTGVAAQLCGDRATVESLGYKVDDAGTIYQPEQDENGKTVWKPFSKLGARRAVLNDLSPAATFIAYNFNTPVDVRAFEREANQILKEVEAECGWMYATLTTTAANEATTWAEKLRACRTADEARALIASILCRGTINYTVWSDVFVCPDCTEEVIFWHAAVDKEAGKVRDEFPCPHCGASLTKRNMDRAWVTRYDKSIGETIRQAKQVPVLINYSVGKKRYEKTPDAFDLALIEKIEELDIPYWFPTDRMPEGEESRRNDDIGLTHVHHFYTKRNLWVLGALSSKFKNRNSLHGLFVLTGLLQISSIQSSFRFDNRNPKNTAGGILKGTLYVPSLPREGSIFENFKRRFRAILSSDNGRCIQIHNILESRTLGFAPIDNSIDYIFTDPPFGGNLMYSELNFLWESWLKVFTNNEPEAIENKVQGKGLPEYQRLMTECFREYYRVLKPGRWMTVEFHNSKNSVWNSIQEALQTAGFVIADVRTLDKKQGSFKQVTSANAVKQDLVISCYKPNGGLEERFKREAGTEEGVWDFVRTHLKQLPVFVSKDGKAEVIAERQNYLLFDRMVAFHVQRGVTVPLSAAEFYAGLAQRFPERDGMYFLPEQVAEYDKKRMKVKEILQLQLFVTDEASAIQWLKQQLTRKPQTAGDLKPQFMQEIGGWKKNEKMLELDELLEQNFLRYDGKGPIPAQLVSWMKQSADLRKIIQEELASGRAAEENGQLSTQSSVLITRAKDRWYVPDPNKASDLEKLRERALLREFEEYRESKQRRLKVFRLEAVRAGFKKAWQDRDYATIIAVARKIPDNVLQEDPKLLMWYDQAVTRVGGES